MLKRSNLGLVALLICITLNNVQGDFSSAGAGFLTIYPGARAVSMGGAFCGLADDALATYYNPAGLAFQRTVDVSWNWLQDFFSYMPHSYPGTYYCNYVSISIPLYNQITIAPAIIFLSDTEIGKERSYAMNFNVGFPLSDILGVGVGIKYIHTHFLKIWWPLEWRTANAVAADIGGLIRVRSPPKYGQLSFGIAFQNVGPRIHYFEIDESDPLPTALRIGLSYVLKSQDILPRVAPQKLNFSPQWLFEHFSEEGRICLATDLCSPIVGSQSFQDIFKDSWYHIGIEIAPLALLAIRVGYIYHVASIYDTEIWRTGWTWGLGFSLRSFRFNVAKAVSGYEFPMNNWRFEIGVNDTPSWLR